MAITRKKQGDAQEIWEDKWIDTACGGCYSGCAIRVHRVNGVCTSIEGNADTPLGGKGGLCGKGAAGLMNLYDPNRLNVPLRRTNPRKGVGEDPEWEEITWEEAMDEIVKRLKQIRADNPQKLWQNSTTSHGYGGWAKLGRDWLQFFGSSQRLSSGGAIHCGNGAHHNSGLVHGSWSATADWKYTNYVLKWGSSKGTGSGHSMTINARMRAEAVERGMKEVCFDPMCNFAAGKSSEWVPILPGTDAAVALAIANVLVNELNVYDADFLGKKTNLAFLLDEEGRFVRDADRGEPMVWNSVENRPELHDAAGIKESDFSLEGSYIVNGVKCVPAFVPFRKHLEQFTPEWAEDKSTVSASTTRRIAEEFGENACIGSTVEIEGKQYPLRPVASISFRGVTGHTNGTHQCWALDLLNILVGAEDVPGGCVGWPVIRLGHPDTGHCNMLPGRGQEGVIIPRVFSGGGHSPWPIKLPSLPVKGGRCDEFWPMCTTSGVPHMKDRAEVWDKLGVGAEAEPEMLIVLGGNLAVSVASWEDQVKLFEDVPLIVQVDLFANETAEALADILLPDQGYLERLDWYANLMSYFKNHPPTDEEWSYHPQQPVVEEPIGQRRNWLDVVVELADRVGFRRELNDFFNDTFEITDQACRLGPEEQLSWAEIGDRVLRWCFGEERGWSYFQENGYIKWPKRVEELYWRWDWPGLEGVRIPVYREYHLDIGQRAQELGRDVGLEIGYEQYSALPDYFVPESHKDMDEDFDLLAFSYRDILHTNSQTPENPWLDEISQLCPYTYNITMNTATAEEKGLEDGDMVWLETPFGKQEKGRLKVIQGQHPRTVGIAGQAGLWAKGRPIASGKGSNFDHLLESDLRHYDPMTLNIETAAAVRIYRAEAD